jgi:predicted nucleic acid-binding protein
MYVALEDHLMTYHKAELYLEAEAVLSIISRCESGEWKLLSSGVIDFEISLIPDSEIQEKVNALYSTAIEHCNITDEIANRAKEFHVFSISHFDSIHIAVAESACVDVMLTTDDRLIRRSQNSDVSIKVANPVSWIMEVTKDE